MSDLVDVVIDAKNLQQGARLTGVSFQCREGQIFGITGDRFSGKSTMLEAISCLRTFASGELYVLGLNSKNHNQEIKHKIGYVTQVPNLDKDFNVFENLTVYASYYGVDATVADRRTVELLRFFGLDQKKDRWVDELDPLETRLLLIARALVHRPSILFVDEPTERLEPREQAIIWSVINKLRTEVKTLVIASNQMNPLGEIADQVVCLEKGRAILSGSPIKILEGKVGTTVIEFTSPPGDISYYLSRLRQHSISCQSVGDIIHIHLIHGQSEEQVWQLLPHRKLQIREPQLGDAFLKTRLELKAQAHP